MIPLRDTVPSVRVPTVTYVLIAANVCVFLYQVQLGSAAEAFVYHYGLVPRRFLRGSAGPLFTSMFMHGGWMHLIGNMLYLHIFGDNVEDRLGHARYLALYFMAGITAGLTQVVTNPASAVPMVGASGAIAGITGAYLVFYPRARVVTLVPVFVFLQVVEIPAFFFLVVWFLFQLMLGLGSLGGDTEAGIAFWAHIGGFVAGMVLGPALAPPRSPPRPAW